MYKTEKDKKKISICLYKHSLYLFLNSTTSFKLNPNKNLIHLGVKPFYNNNNS